MGESVADYFGFTDGEEIVRTSRVGAALPGADKNHRTSGILAGFPQFQKKCVVISPVC
jgi:hypothetical protein